MKPRDLEMDEIILIESGGITHGSLKLQPKLTELTSRIPLVRTVTFKLLIETLARHDHITSGNLLNCQPCSE